MAKDLRKCTERIAGDGSCSRGGLVEAIGELDES